MKTLLIGGALLALAIPAVAQVAQPAPAAPAAPRAERAHTRAEVQARVAEHFARVDANRDGFVTKAEADAGKQAMRGKMRERFGERLEGRGEGMAGARMADRGAAFDRLDTNRDGAISRQEWDSARAMREQRMAGRRGGAEGGHHKGMRMGMGMGMGALGGHMFEMADANKDGRVSLAEAQAAALRHFDMVDANRDGRITPDERSRMRDRMRMERRS